MKKIITIEEVKQKLRINYSFGFQIYLHIPRNALELYEWGNFEEKFKSLLENI